MRNYHYDLKDPLRPLIRSTVANPGSLPPKGAVRIAPPAQEDIPEGMVPVWDGGAWALAEDHRKEKGWVNGAATVIENVGPYPVGWSDSPPPPTAAELVAADRAEKLSRLAAIDWESIRPLRAVAEDVATEADSQKLADLEAEAAGLRASLPAAPPAPMDEPAGGGGNA